MDGGLQVFLCHIQAIIKNAKLHTNCELSGCVSPCPCLFLVEDTDYRTVEEKENCKHFDR